MKSFKVSFTNYLKSIIRKFYKEKSNKCRKKTLNYVFRTILKKFGIEILKN